jgi:hypothetical protein
MCKVTLSAIVPQKPSMKMNKNMFPIQEVVVDRSKTTVEAFAVDEPQVLPALKVAELDDSSEASLCGSFVSALDHFHMPSTLCAQSSIGSISRETVILHRKRNRSQRNQAMTSLDFELLVFSQLDMTLGATTTQAN